MKKFLVVLLLIVLCSSSCSADDGKDVKVGFLGYLGTTEEAFQEDFDIFRDSISREFARKYSKIYPLAASLKEKRRVVRFYNSLMTLLMGLRSGNVDEIILPEAVGRYVLKMNSMYELEFTSSMMVSRLSFAFMNNNEKLKAEFDEAITAMREDGTLARLQEDYIDAANEGKSIRAVAPETFRGAEVIKAAVTGDIPPIDMFAGNGKPSGYSTAILAEIGKRLKKNIQFTSINAGARSQALASERADVVFWYRTTESTVEDGRISESLAAVFRDKPDGIILSVPYYEWTTDYVIKVGASKKFLGIF